MRAAARRCLRVRHVATMSSRRRAASALTPLLYMLMSKRRLMPLMLLRRYAMRPPCLRHFARVAIDAAYFPPQLREPLIADDYVVCRFRMILFSPRLLLLR